MRVYATVCGHLEMEFGRLVKDETGTIRIPVPCYVIEHSPRGSWCSIADCAPDLPMPPILSTRLMRPTRSRWNSRRRPISRAVLALLGHDVRDVRYLINSHIAFRSLRRQSPRAECAAAYSEARMGGREGSRVSGEDWIRSGRFRSWPPRRHGRRRPRCVRRRLGDMRANPRTHAQGINL